MARKNCSQSKRQDGRILAARLLVHMERLNRGTPNNLESRKVLLVALQKFTELGARQQVRFTSALNEFIGSAMQGAVLDASLFIRENAHQLEGRYARINAIERSELTNKCAA